MKYFFLILIVLISSISFAQLPPPPVLSPGESWTNLWSVSYDFQSNGSIRYLDQDPSNPSNFCAIMMAQQDSNNSGITGRYVYYSYSEDNGLSWVPEVIAPFPQGFPCLTLSNGRPVIAFQGVFSNVVIDVFFGGYSFFGINGSPNLNYPQITGASNGNLILGGSNAQTLQFNISRYNGSSWSSLTNITGLGGPSGQASIESGPNGKVSIFGVNYNGDHSFRWFESSDNGLTFTSQPIFPWVIDENDTLYVNIAGGFQAVYDNSGNVHVVFTAYKEYKVGNPPNTTGYTKSGIYHWSSATGLNIIADNLNILALEDTLTQVLVAPLCQPTIGITSNGKLRCAFTTYLKNNKQIVQDGSIVNAGEIFVSESVDNGITWKLPNNLTNTPGIEEKHPSLLRISQNNDIIKIFYLRDMKAGACVIVPAWGKAPVYGIYLSFNTINNETKSSKIFPTSKNYPNPFNPSTKIYYKIERPEFVTLNIYDVSGKLINTLVNESKQEGNYEVEFNGSGLSSGVYYYTLNSGDYRETRKMILMK